MSSPSVQSTALVLYVRQPSAPGSAGTINDVAEGSAATPHEVPVDAASQHSYTAVQVIGGPTNDVVDYTNENVSEIDFDVFDEASNDSAHDQRDYYHRVSLMTNFDAETVAAAGGIDNYKKFVSVLLGYIKSSETQHEIFKDLRQELTNSDYDFVFCVGNKYLFQIYLENCKSFQLAAWFYKIFSRRKLESANVTVEECM